MEGFTVYATGCGKARPVARKVMDSFHVAHMAAEKLTTLQTMNPAGNNCPTRPV
ncbi:hypothetical protein PQG76_11095 [Corynebacterium falsenii]|uniref:hypothetical protein n=1 Tax=Corynebacterium falsenii TaxID=108486 RepID=UPI00234CCFCF|nr:hypothetical protein [Corynebacterium falsenii]MDC7105050.1 hypothetical protein [Corynebacterium falsenii]